MIGSRKKPFQIAPSCGADKPLKRGSDLKSRPSRVEAKGRSRGRSVAREQEWGSFLGPTRVMGDKLLRLQSFPEGILAGLPCG